MKYRLNLYTSRFRPRYLLLDRRMLVAAVGLAALLVIFSGVWLNQVNRDLAAQHKDVTRKQTELQANMVGLSGRLDARVEDQQLQQDIAVHTQIVNGKRQLIKQLSDRLLLADVRFSRYMHGLSKSHVEGLWLTRVRAQGRDLILDGRSLSEDLLPQWIQQLSSQTDFHGKSFGLLELSRQKDAETSHLDFHLSTQLKRDEKGNG